MREELSRYELIDRYLNNELVGEELEDFEHKLNTDNSFREDLEDVKISNEVILDQGLLDFKARIKNFDPSSNNENKTNFLKGKNRWILGASSFILISGLLFYLNSNNIPSNQKEINYVNISNTKTLDTTIDSGFPTNNNLTSDDAKKNSIEKSVPSNTSSVETDEKINSENKVEADPNPNSNITAVEIQKYISSNIHTEKTVVDSSAHHLKIGKTLLEKVDCGSIQISAHYKLSEPCPDQASGSIAFDASTIKGGTKPYEYSIDGGHTFQTQTNFNHLRSEDYQLVIKEKNGCTSTIGEVFLKTKNCDEPKEFAFSPDRGETWEIPLKEHTEAELKIFNPAGEMVFYVFIKGGYPANWDGHNLPMGSYSYLLTNKNELIGKGFVTIVR